MAANTAGIDIKQNYVTVTLCITITSLHRPPPLGSRQDAARCVRRRQISVDICSRRSCCTSPLLSILYDTRSLIYRTEPN